MPRGGGLLGKVLIFTWNMTNQQNITGEQIGAYFGYSLCVVDVDGDKLDDLIIGAPMHTEPNNEGNYEMGRVYIMYQGNFVSCFLTPIAFSRIIIILINKILIIFE